MHEKGVKGVELGKCSLLSEKTLTRGTPLPPFLKVRELGKKAGFFRELRVVCFSPNTLRNHLKTAFPSYLRIYKPIFFACGALSKMEQQNRSPRTVL